MYKPKIPGKPGGIAYTFFCRAPYFVVVLWTAQSFDGHKVTTFDALT